MWLKAQKIHSFNIGHAYWSQYPENVRNTLDAVEFLAKRYKDEVAFLGKAFYLIEIYMEWRKKVLKPR